MDANKLTAVEQMAILAMHDDGKRLTEICSVVKKDSDIISRFLHESGRAPITAGKPFKITDDKKEKCIRMWLDGCNCREIAFDLSIGESTARKICRDYKEQTQIATSDCMIPLLQGDTQPTQIVEGLEMILKGIVITIEALKQQEEDG